MRRGTEKPIWMYSVRLTQCDHWMLLNTLCQAMGNKGIEHR